MEKKKKSAKQINRNGRMTHQAQTAYTAKLLDEVHIRDNEL